MNNLDIKHHYTEHGAGEYLILLHGNGENSSYFDHQINHFSAYYHVIALDTRGHGRTPRGNTPFTIRQFAWDLLHFMDNQGISKANILGFSDGANIAMLFAIAHPERVIRLVLNGGNLDARGIKPSTQLWIEAGHRLARLFAPWSVKAKAHAEMLGLMVNDPNIETASLRDIKAETLVIAGSHDMVKETHTKHIASNIPNARLSIIEGDHFVANRRPEAFNSVVLNFLQTQTAESAGTGTATARPALPTKPFETIDTHHKRQ